MQCHACNRDCTDKELKQDLVGWREFKPMCKRCLGTIVLDEIDNLNKFQSLGFTDEEN